VKVAGSVKHILDIHVRPPAHEQASSVRQGLEERLALERRRSTRILILAAFALFGWAAWVPLSGAVVVPGSIVVQSSVKKVQHPQGGIVAAILASNGTKVAAGDELVRLDQIATRANLQVVARQLDEVRLRIARLKAERDDSDEPQWPPESAAELEISERAELLSSERNLFLARARARHSQRDLTKTRLDQLATQVSALESQLKSNDKQADIAGGELKGVEELLRQKLVTLPRATTLQREAAHLDGLKGQFTAQIAEARAKESEVRLQALQSDESFRSEALRDLREAEAKEGELAERYVATRDQMQRTIIRAPSDGIIHELMLHTVGGVIAPGEVLMLVVPENDALSIEARLSADRVDHVRAGQAARVRLSAFDQTTTPELPGRVELVSADIVHDAQSGASYYRLRIALSAEALHRVGNLHLVPGMPAEVFLETEGRTMLSYLFKPLTDQLLRAFPER